MPQRIYRLMARHFAGLSIIGLTTLLYLHGGLVNGASIGFLFLLAILCASTLWGLGVSVMMSVAATLIYDFYVLPPVNTFNITDPRDWLALFSFIATATIGSYLSTRARRDAEEADRRRNEVEGLYEFSQRLLYAGNQLGLLKAIPMHIVETFGVGAVAIFFNDTHEVYQRGLDLKELEALKSGLLTFRDSAQDLQGETERRICVVPLRLGENEIGSVRISLGKIFARLRGKPSEH